jgi:hypothetical protein
MSKTLSFSKDRVRVLVSTELDSVLGGVKESSALPDGGTFANPTATAVSSAFNGGGAAQATATAVSSALNGGGAVSPTSSAVSSARPVHHRKHSPKHDVSSAIPSSAVITPPLG